jgi:hypothetical protein
VAAAKALREHQLMKAALCISGQMRTYRHCFASLKQNILDPLNPDVFIYTWSDAGSCTRIEKDERQPSLQAPVTHDRLRTLYHPKSAIIQEYKTAYAEEMHGVRVPDILKKMEPHNYRGAIPMFFTMYQCNELKRQYEADGGFQYDVVIRLRPDLLISELIPKRILENPGVLWVSGYQVNPSFQVSDKFASSMSSQMDYYSSVWKLLPKYWENPLGDGKWENHRVGERLMKLHLDSSRIPYESFFISCRIQRSFQKKETSGISMDTPACGCDEY